MTNETISKIIGAVVALALLGAAAFFWTQGGRDQAAGLITAALGLVALVIRSPLERRGKASDRQNGNGPPPAGGTALLVLVLVLSAATQGCSGPPREVRLIPQEVAGALDFADELLANRIAAMGPEVRAQVRAEVAAGDIVGVDDEDTVARGLARFEELMAGPTLARTALRVARRGTLSLERVIAAWGASVATEGAFIASAACVGAALAEAAAALQAADMELPTLFLDVVAFVAPFASGACPGPAAQVAS